MCQPIKYAINRTEHLRVSSIKWIVCKTYFFECFSRKMLLKHLISIGCCLTIKIIGSIFRILIGNEYQSSCSIASPISNNALVNVIPSSHGIDGTISDHHRVVIDTSNRIGLFASYGMENVIKTIHCTTFNENQMHSTISI